jgi:LysR family glycine cleavage system transcriptional activator
MARRLPPLNALRAFEAAARHLSFTKAAAELHVTQAAVSHQVKQLEEDLAAKLFQRLTRRLRLTDEGQALLQVASSGLDDIARAATEIRERALGQTLTVTMTPSFSASWLMSRLGRFWEQHPSIDLKLQHSMRSATLADFRAGSIDLAVRWGVGPWAGLESEPLIPADQHPICSPALAEGRPPLRVPADLQHHVLLYEVSIADWRLWLNAAGVPDLKPRGTMMIDDMIVMLRAVAESRGVGLAPKRLITEELASGRLLLPFGDSHASGACYHLVYLPGAHANPAVAAFSAFLKAEAETEAGAQTA